MFKIKDGTKMDTNLFLILAKFGIPTNNTQTALALLTELIKLRSMQENKNINNNKKRGL